MLKNSMIVGVLMLALSSSADAASPGCQHADAGECYEGCVGVRSVPMRVETWMARSCAGIRCLGAASSARVLLREAPPSLG
jgi:hypothetical protein